MDKSDTWFVGVATVVGVVSGFFLGESFGKVGVVFGVIGGFTVVFVFCTLTRFLGQVKPWNKDRKSEQEN